jgi:hypothetical protein
VPDLLYQLNASDEIFSVNEDVETQHIYRLLHRRVRTGGEPVRFSFRCDGPGRRKLLELSISAGGEQGLIYRVRTLREEDRKPVPLLDPHRPARRCS